MVVVAAVFLVYATMSRRLRGTSITAPIVFVGAGFLFGPKGFGWLHLTLDEQAVSTLAEAATQAHLGRHARQRLVDALRPAPRVYDFESSFSAEGTGDHNVWDDGTQQS